jgi:uncharacterized hydrophobic protein (TIGR00271 family)
VNDGAADDAAGADVSPRRTIWNQWRHPPDPRVVAALSRRVYAYDLDRHSALKRYFALLVFAVLMATFGLHKDSALIILSAMLLEQVMLPIVAFSLGLVTGEPRRQMGAGFVILASAGVAVTLSWLVTMLALSDRSLISSQIVANSAPNMTDLVVALIAGVACGYILIYRETLSALPGVAVGLTLVPPLCAAGYLLAHGERSLAQGALLMFATNLAAIIFACSIVFVLAGFLPSRTESGLPVRIKVGIVSAVIAVAIIAYPLQRVTNAIIRDARDEATVLQVTTDWVDGTTFKIEEVNVDGELVEITLSGPVTPVTADDLANDIAASIGRRIDLELEIIRTSSLTVEGAPD